MIIIAFRSNGFEIFNEKIRFYVLSYEGILLKLKSREDSEYFLYA